MRFSWLWLPALAACSVGAIELAGKRCPCVNGFTCDTRTDTCVVTSADGGGAADASAACASACLPDIGAVCIDGQCTPPHSCSELMTMSPRPASGVFRLAPQGAAAGGTFDAYCELDPSANGGGWTLVLKVDGNSNRFAYDGALWLNGDTYNGDKPSLDTTEAKLGGFGSMPVAEARIGMLDGGRTRWVVVPVAAPSLLELCKGAYSKTSLGRDAWRGLVASPSTQANCNREGFNALVDDAGAGLRIGMLFNNENDCATPDSFIGIGSSFGNTAGNFARATVADNGGRDTRVFAYVMIR
jgi:hypothetical protein